MSLVRVQTVGWTSRAGSAPVLATCILLALGVADLRAQATPAGAVIRNAAGVTYRTAAGDSGSAGPDSAVITVGQVAAVIVAPPRTGVTVPGTTVVFAHSLANLGNGADTFALTAATRRGWPTRLYSDVNRHGALDAGDLPVTTAALAAGDTADLLVAVDVPAAAGGMVDTLDVRATSQVSPAVAATIGDVITVLAAASGQLVLTKAADVLEIGLGETAPYTLTVENAGSAPLSDIRIADRLPAGGRYVRGSIIGADSVTAAGRDLTIYVAGPLAVGGSHTVRYRVAIVSADETVLENHAIATAEAGLVTSVPVVAWVRVRRGAPLETRAVIGKIWSDRNANGVQDADEPGVGGVDVWTDDGEIATSDADGRFSFRNQRPGRHAYRLDPTTLPPGYTAPPAAAQIAVRDGSGWTTPRVTFPLSPMPGASPAVTVRLPVRVQFVARPICAGLGAVLPGAGSDRAAVAYFPNNSARPQYVLPPAEIGRRMRVYLADRPECAVEIVGHTDAADVHGGPYWTNQRLSDERAEWVAYTLGWTGGLRQGILSVRGRADAEAVASGPDTAAAARNRRVDLGVVDRRGGAAAYEVTVSNPYDVELRGLALDFAPAADAVSLSDGTLLARQGGPWLLPTILPHGAITVHARARATDSAAVRLVAGAVSTRPIRVEVHNPLRSWVGSTEPVALAQELPDPRSVASGAAVEVTLTPPTRGWSGFVEYAVPAGWEFVPATARAGSDRLPEPRVRLGSDGQTALRFPAPANGACGAVTLMLRPAGSTPTPEPVTLPPLRSGADRADRNGALLTGPGVVLFAPADGAVVPTDRVFVGVRGQPGAAVELFDGATSIARAELRPDGVHDFVAVPLSRGPHRLRVRMVNSWNRERWDSLHVHVSGLAARVETERDPIALVADGQSVESVRARVLDRWNVAVTGRVFVTLSADGAEIVNADEDASSVGLQARTDAAGWLSVRLRGRREVRVGSLTLVSGDARTHIVLEVRPAAAPLMLTAVGRVGAGAAPDAFGAISARGRLDERTSLVASFDSRRLDAGREDFGRSVDPLAEEQYPVLGDGSRSRTLGASPSVFAARIERGFDWLAVGDLSTAEFAGGLTLAGYDRALSGLAARVTTGPVVWQGFGSATSRQLAQVQIRGSGVSGPFPLASLIQPGTERVVLETRAPDNAQHVLARQELARFVDYQIDYERGILLLARPVPATDGSGNPLFIVVSYDVETGGATTTVWGVRATADARGLARSAGLDSLRVGSTFIRDGRPGSDRVLTGFDLGLVRGRGLTAHAELARSDSADSSGYAAAVEGALTLAGGAVSLTGGWLRTDAQFRNPANVAIQGGGEDLRLGARLAAGATELRLDHSAQRFETQEVTRSRSGVILVRSFGTVRAEAGLVADRFETTTSADASRAGELKLTWQALPALSLWTEARHQLADAGNGSLPDHIGGGARLRISPRGSLEAFHRQARLPGGAAYGVTSFGVRSHLGAGTEAWGSYQLTGARDAHDAAVLGLNSRVRLSGAWTVQALFERRVGLDRASAADPLRALPFLQTEEDYWSAGLGVDLVPTGASYRLSTHAELRDGALRSNRLVRVTGDVALSRGFAALARIEFLGIEQHQATGSTLHHRFSSLTGLALRPTGSDALNVLAKLERVDALNPLSGGVLAGQTGRETRTSLAAEAIWSPVAQVEVAGRYAVRRTGARTTLADGTMQPLGAWAEYGGARLGIDVTSRFALRAEGRLLHERNSGTIRWDLAPEVAVVPVSGIEVAAGYRVGDLRDPDFAVRGGRGWFVTVGAAVTERALTDIAAFWRARLRN